MAERQWWERPHLLTAATEHEERKVSWLELFYDLVYVVVVAELAHYLAKHASLDGVFGYILMFVPVWWIWFGGAIYNARFETGDISYRLFTFLQMLPLAALTIFTHDGLGKTSAPFALAYVVARLLLIFMWVRGGLHNPIMRPVTNRFAIGFGLSAALFTVSVFVPPPWRFAIWVVALVIDLSTPLWTFPHQARLPRLSNAKLPERYGLFVIIVLGEAIVGVVGGAAEQQEFNFVTGGYLALGMVLVFSLWWVYFDYVARHTDFRQPRTGMWWFLSWGYLHLPLVMAIAAISSGVLNLLTTRGPVADSIRWLTCGAMAMAIITIALIEISLRRDPDEPTDLRVSIALKLVTALLALALGQWGVRLGPAMLLLALCALNLTHMLYGAYVWYRPFVMKELQS